MPKRRSNSPKKKQQPNGTKNNSSSSRLPFIAAAVIGVLAAVAAYWRNDAEETPWQPRPSDAYAPLKKISGVLIEDFVPPRIIEELRYQLMDAVNGTCAAPTMVCFDPARVDVATGEAASLLPPWLANATAAEVVERPGASHCVRGIKEADAHAATASVSFVSSRDEFVAAKAVERAVQSAVGLPGSHGLFQQLLYYPPGAPGYASHRDCRDDREAAAAAAGGAAPQERAFTTLLYLSDNASGETSFPTLRASIKPRAGRFVAWRSLKNGDCDPNSAHAAGPVLITDAPKLVLQRWYERAPYLPGPNAHGEPWTRCSLGEDGSVDSCRTYCASQRARAASDALRFGMEAFTAHKSGLDPDARAAAVEALSDALSLLPGLSLAQVLLAHALYDGAEIDEARVCDLCARFLADYPALKGVSEDAEVMLEELQCDGGLVERHRSLALHEIAAARGRPRAA